MKLKTIAAIFSVFTLFGITFFLVKYSDVLQEREIVSTKHKQISLKLSSAAVNKKLENACSCQKDRDPANYLYKVCIYVKKNKINISPANPCNYKIKEIDDNSAKITYVYLDCCYLGDLAVFDKKTKEIIRFTIGDI